MFNNEITFDIARTTRHVLYDDTQRYRLLMWPTNIKATAFRFDWKDIHTKKVVAKGYQEGTDAEVMGTAWKVLEAYKKVSKLDEKILQALNEDLEEGDLDLSDLHLEPFQEHQFWDVVRKAKDLTKPEQGYFQKKLRHKVSFWLWIATFACSVATLFLGSSSLGYLMSFFAVATAIAIWRDK